MPVYYGTEAYRTDSNNVKGSEVFRITEPVLSVYLVFSFTLQPLLLKIQVALHSNASLKALRFNW